MIVRCKSDNDSVGYYVDGGLQNYMFFRLIGLTIDKSYPVTGIDNIGYRIIDDELRNFWYTKELFYPIEDERDKKLKQIGI